MKFTHNDISVLLVTIYTCLAWLDVILTTFGIVKGGTELNTFLSPFVHPSGPFIAVKMMGVALIVILALFCRYITRKGDYVVMSTACSLGIIPVVWNPRALGWWYSPGFLIGDRFWFILNRRFCLFISCIKGETINILVNYKSTLFEVLYSR